MRPPAPPLLRAALGIAILLAGHAAQGQVEPVRLRYAGHAACPDRAAFAAQVEARTSKARWVETEEAVRELEVALVRVGEETEGTLRIRAPGADEAMRRVRGESCDEVVAALALITALAIDPKAKVTTPAASPTLPEVPASAPPEVPASAPAPTPTSHTAAPAPPNAATPSRLPPVALGSAGWPIPGIAVPTRRATSPWLWTVGLGAQVTSAMDFRASFVLPVFVDLAMESRQWLAPSFRLAAAVLPDRVVDAELGTARFSRLAGELWGCPLRLALAPSVALRPCLGVELGTILGKGSTVAEAGSGAAAWLALDAGARLDFSPASWLLLEAQGAVGAALVRARFYYEPDTTLLEADPVFGTAGGAVGVRFR